MLLKLCFALAKGCIVRLKARWKLRKSRKKILFGRVNHLELYHFYHPSLSFLNVGNGLLYVLILFKNQTKYESTMRKIKTFHVREVLTNFAAF